MSARRLGCPAHLPERACETPAHAALFTRWAEVDHHTPHRWRDDRDHGRGLRFLLAEFHRARRGAGRLAHKRGRRHRSKPSATVLTTSASIISAIRSPPSLPSKAPPDRACLAVERRFPAYDPCPVPRRAVPHFPVDPSCRRFFSSATSTLTFGGTPLLEGAELPWRRASGCAWSGATARANRRC